MARRLSPGELGSKSFRNCSQGLLTSCIQWRVACRSDGSELAGQFAQFLCGVPRAQLPAFTACVAIFRFVLIVERSMEGLHAQTHKVMLKTPHVSVPYIGPKHHIPEIRACLRKEPGVLMDLAREACRVKRPLDVAVELGFSAHLVMMNFESFLAQRIHGQPQECLDDRLGYLPLRCTNARPGLHPPWPRWRLQARRSPG